MKRAKKLLSLVLAMMLVLAMGSTVIAAAPSTPTVPGGENEHTIVIKNENGGHTYGAYQIFSGTFYEGKLSNIDWGKNVDGERLLAALKADAAFGEGEGNAFAGCTTAQEVAGILGTFKDNSAMLDSFADQAGKFLKDGPAATSVEGTAAEGEKTPYTITVVGDGYYLVQDEEGTITDTDTFTKYILQVVGDVNVDAKSEAMSVKKTIVDEDGNDITINDVNVGDVIPYKITSKVPATNGFESFTFVVRDKAGAGLTFDNKPVVKVGNDTLVRGVDYDVYAITIAEDGTVTRGEVIAEDAVVPDGQSFDIVFADFVALQAKYTFNAGDDIVITYNSTVNEAALTTIDGNKNEASILYSKDPANPDEPLGETPSSQTVSYIANIQLQKIDGTSKNPLSGAQFELFGSSLNKVKTTGVKFVKETEIVEGSGYELADDKNYYLLKDGSYTSTAPGEPNVNQDSYAEPDTVYKKVTYTKYEEVETQKTITAWVDDQGILKFEGLGAGKYTITELVAPDGYNLLQEPIYIEIELAITDDLDTEGNPVVVWNAYYLDKDGNRLTDDAGEVKKVSLVDGSGNIFNLEVVNNSGATLPSTGGIGTTIFYILGGILVVGAGIMLVVKKRMSSEK